MGPWFRIPINNRYELQPPLIGLNSSTGDKKSDMVFHNVFLVPLILFVLVPVSFVVTYAVAVSLKHVEPGFPYISDTGTSIPESCIFSQCFNTVAILFIGTVYIRYKQVEQYYRDHLSAESNTVLKLNRASLWCGWIAAFGVTILANFQVTSILIVHITGAFIAFGFGTIYTWLQTVMSYYVYPLLNTILTARIRLTLSLICTATFIITTAAGVIAVREFHGKSVLKWNPEDGGYIAHVISSSAEWILVLAFDFFILTFVREMHQISVESPKVHFLPDTHCLTSDMYHNEDNVEISQSQSSYISPTVESVSANVFTTQAILH